MSTSCAVRILSDSTKKFSETDIFNMFEFLIDNIFAMFGGRVFQQTVGIPIGTNCAPLLADLFLYSYEADFIQGLLKKNEKKLARSFNFTFHCIDDVLSLNNSRFGDFVDRIYPIELEIKDIVVCPFVLFLLAIVLSVLLRYTDSDCPFGIFKLFFNTQFPRWTW